MRRRSASALLNDDDILYRALTLGLRVPVAEATIFFWLRIALD